MNYIAHLTGFLQRSSEDYRLNPSHVSLYLALFQQWNLNRFRNPVSIARPEVMRLSRIHSRVTYHKCLKELHAWGYLHYEPSYNHFRGSLVYMLSFEKTGRNGTAEEQLNFCTGLEPEVNGDYTGAGQELGPSINIENSINNLNILKERYHAREKSEGLNSDQEDEGRSERKEKSCAKKEKKEAVPVPPELDQVQAFFRAAGQPERKALLFFHHYGASGWKLANGLPVEDWQAAARKWILLDDVFTSKRKNDADHQPGLAAAPERNYAEPL